VVSPNDVSLFVAMRPTISVAVIAHAEAGVRLVAAVLNSTPDFREASALVEPAGSIAGRIST